MIITKAPFRVSFAGGFSDAAARERGEEGAVLSATVNLHAYITVQRRKDAAVVAAYSSVEKVADAKDVVNALFREAIVRSGTRTGVEVHSIGVLSLASSGLGGSSAAAVGMVLGLARLRGLSPGARAIAEEAAAVEIVGIGRSIGKQDHYAAAYGGLNVFHFRGEGVKVQRLDEAYTDVLDGCMVMAPCHSSSRDASEMLKEQLKADPGIPRALAGLVPDVLSAFEDGDFKGLVAALREGWRLKKLLSPRLSNPTADAAVAVAESLDGAGKLCGAGGTGHVWAIVPFERAQDFLEAVPGSFRVEFEPRGAWVIHDDGERAE